MDSFAHRWSPGDAEGLEGSERILIGRPYPGVEALVVDEALREVEAGCEGELLLGGEQVGPGYFLMPEENERKFVVPPGRSLRYYRTGGRVRKPLAEEIYVFRGRFDHQIKVRGNRVELGEVEEAICQESGGAEVLALGWPEIPGGANGVAAFVGNEAADVKSLAARLEARLPAYMVPT